MAFSEPFRRTFNPTFDRRAGVITYLLRDEFTDTLPAGSVNGTPATPGPGTRAVTDTNNKLSIGSGNAIIATGGAGVSNPRLHYGAITRALGRFVIVSITTGTLTRAGYIGFDNDTLTTFSDAFRFGAAPDMYAFFNGSTAVIGSWATSTAYKLAVVMRASGDYHFLNTAGAGWRLMWVSTAGTGNLYPGFAAILTNDEFTVDYIRIPQDTWLPTPLCYDTFTRSNGAIGTSETTGPDAQAVTARTWTGATWTIATQKAINTPVTLGGGM